MRLLSYLHQKQKHVGVLSLDQKYVIDLADILDTTLSHEMNDVIPLLTASRLATLTQTLSTRSNTGIPIEEIQLLAPITKPQHDILCVGVNYADHANEVTSSLHMKKQDTQNKPVLFSKRAHVLLGTNEPLIADWHLDTEVDYEVELAVIIRKTGKNIAADQIQEHILGYSIFNDFSSRKLQRAHSQWFRGKSLDGYAALGPYIVTPDEFSLAAGTTISSTVNEELRQNSTLGDMIHSVAAIIVELSQGMTLEAGDIIATGTPAGVGMGYTPPKYLMPGDTVHCTIAGLGTLTTPIH